MSWRTGSSIFLEIWPIIEKNISNENELSSFSKDLIDLFVSHDMDIHDLLNFNDSLNKSLEQNFGLVEEEEGFIGHDNENSLLMKISKSISEKYNMKLEEGEDCVELMGVIESNKSLFYVSLYNFSNRIYSFSFHSKRTTFDKNGLGIEDIKKDSEAEVRAEYDGNTESYIRSDLNYENLLKVCTEELHRHVINPDGWSDPEPVFFDESENEYNERLNKICKVKI
jgi:hypothetical protein